MNKAKTATDQLTTSTKKFDSEGKVIGETLRVTNGQVDNFSSKIKDVIKNITSWAVAMRLLKEGYQIVKDMDDALTEYKKVSDLTGDSLDDFVQKAREVGSTVARTGTEMIEATTEFKKSGYSDEDSLQLAKIAAEYQNVADEQISAGESASFIIAQMKAFNIEAKNATSIIDAVNEVSNNYAVSSADLANNLGIVSATMASGDTTLEQTLGLVH